MGTFGYGNFWAALFLTVVICISPSMGYRWVKQKVHPTLSEGIRRGLLKKQTKFSVSCMFYFKTCKYSQIIFEAV